MYDYADMWFADLSVHLPKWLKAIPNGMTPLSHTVQQCSTDCFMCHVLQFVIKSTVSFWSQSYH